MYLFKTITIGLMKQNCYLFGDADSREVFLIDPGDQPNRILKVIEEEKVRVKYILLTHGHFDHCTALPKVKEACGALFAAHPAECRPGEKDRFFSSMAPDVELADGMELTVGGVTLRCIYTPGHSAGGMSFYADGYLFAGDTIFRTGCGRTDLPGGDFSVLEKSIQKLYTLPDDTKVYCGHEAETTIGFEKRYNPYVRPL